MFSFRKLAGQLTFGRRDNSNMVLLAQTGFQQPNMTSPRELITRYQSLFIQFDKLRSTRIGDLQRAFDRLSAGFRAARITWSLQQRKTADDFNLFEVMNIAGDEVRHSKLLAWLVDPRIERGTHAQGNLGFRLLLHELKDDLGQSTFEKIMTHAQDADYWVYTEVAGDLARVDIEIAARRKFLIHIENKIYSEEGEDQTDREMSDLIARRVELEVPDDTCRAIFLTLHGSDPKNKDFLRLKWNRVAKVLDVFADQSEPPDVKLFARHYAKAIRKLTIVQRYESERSDVEI